MTVARVAQAKPSVVVLMVRDGCGRGRKQVFCTGRSQYIQIYPGADFELGADPSRAGSGCSLRSWQHLLSPSSINYPSAASKAVPSKLYLCARRLVSNGNRRRTIKSTLCVLCLSLPSCLLLYLRAFRVCFRFSQ